VELEVDPGRIVKSRWGAYCRSGEAGPKRQDLLWFAESKDEAKKTDVDHP